MKLLKFLRKQFTAYFLSSLILLSSCSKPNLDDSNTEELSIEELKSIHLNLLSQPNKGSLITQKNSNNRINRIFQANFDDELEDARLNGVEYSFQKRNLDTSWPNTIDWAINNINNENFYDEIQQREHLVTPEQAQLLFSYLQTFQDYENEVIDENRETNNGGRNRRRSSGCTRAVVGAVFATAVFAAVTAGTGGFGAAAAIGFLATKSYATFNVIAACRRGSLGDVVDWEDAPED